MDNDERRKRLLKVLSDRQRLRVDEICNLLHASPATVRRDIAWLAEREMLVRTRGGVEHQAATRQRSLAGATFVQSMGVKAAEKRAIAKRAASMCRSGETIIINGGTTTFMMVEFLTTVRMTIVTNSFLMAEQLVRRSTSEIIIPGGTIYREQNVILSPFDNDVTRHHYAKRMFMGALALSPKGVLEGDPVLIQAERRLITQASELIVLADSAKFNSERGSLILCPLDQIDMVITDSGISAAATQMLRTAGVEVVVVEPERATSGRG